jgi:hypothetical protein
VIHGNRGLTVREVADKMGISIESSHQIFTEKLQMCPISAKFVQHLLFDNQKDYHVEISQEMLANANGNENFLKNIITGDETWVLGYDVETKMQSLQWMGKGSPRPKNHGGVSQRLRCCWTCFLIVKTLSILNFYHVVRY